MSPRLRKFLGWFPIFLLWILALIAALIFCFTIKLYHEIPSQPKEVHETQNH